MRDGCTNVLCSCVASFHGDHIAPLFRNRLAGLVRDVPTYLFLGVVTLFFWDILTKLFRDLLAFGNIGCVAFDNWDVSADVFCDGFALFAWPTFANFPFNIFACGFWYFDADFFYDVCAFLYGESLADLLLCVNACLYLCHFACDFGYGLALIPFNLLTDLLWYCVANFGVGVFANLIWNFNCGAAAMLFWNIFTFLFIQCMANFFWYFITTLSG